MANKYTILSASLHNYADQAEAYLRGEYGLKQALIEHKISDKLSWLPTLHWKTKTGYIACEVSEKPYSSALAQLYANINTSGLPIRIVSAFPMDLSTSARIFQSDINCAKQYGIGLLSIDNANTHIIYNGISVPLHLSPLDLKLYPKALHQEISASHKMYMDGNPKHGIQELGQIIEKILIDLAVQAKKCGKLATSGFVSAGIYYPQNALISDLIKDKILDVGFLKRCGTFADDRNSVSHKPKSMKEAIKQENRLRELYKGGLFIIEDIASQMKSAGYSFQYKG